MEHQLQGIVNWICNYTFLLPENGKRDKIKLNLEILSKNLN